jgi:hypothetical protein
MKEWAKAQTAESEDQFLEILVGCTQIAMKQYSPELSEDRELLENSFLNIFSGSLQLSMHLPIL